jgi:hypothetical protein
LLGLVAARRPPDDISAPDEHGIDDLVAGSHKRRSMQMKAH